ncbi:MAG: OsmC family protein [Chloroflexota bacterium]
MTRHYNTAVNRFVLYSPFSERKMSEEWKEVSAAWKGDMTFIGENAEGGTVQMGSLDGQPGVGPMQLVLVGLAGCTGMDVVSILQKKRALLTDFKVNVRGKRASDHPMVYTHIEVEYLLWGENLKARDVEQAIALSEEKYCSVSIMLKKTAAIRSSYRILMPGQAEA